MVADPKQRAAEWELSSGSCAIISRPLANIDICEDLHGPAQTKDIPGALCATEREINNFVRVGNQRAFQLSTKTHIYIIHNVCAEK